MNKKWLIVGGLVFAIIAVLFAAFLSRTTSKGTCESFIAAIQKNDATTSYEMFTEQARANTPLESWRETVDGLYSALSGGSVTFKQTQTNTDPASLREEIKEEYVVQVGDSKYRATCYLAGTGSGQGVNAFSSKTDLE